MSHSQNGLHSSLNALNLNSSISAGNGNNFLNSSWSSSPNGKGCNTTNGNGWFGQYSQSRLIKCSEVPVPVATLSKAWVCSHSLAEIVGLNPAGGMDGCLL